MKWYYDWIFGIAGFTLLFWGVGVLFFEVSTVDMLSSPTTYISYGVLLVFGIIGFFLSGYAKNKNSR